MSRLWTADEEFILILRRENWKVETIARKLGRTPKAVLMKARKLNCWPTNGELMTSGEAAKISGYTQQWCVKLAKKKKVKAKRTPGGRWWLFSPEEFKKYLKERSIL